MSRTFLGRAVGAVVMLFASLSGAQGSSAQAQTVPVTVQTAVSAEAAAPQAGVSFVSQEVVQPSPLLPRPPRARSPRW